MAKKLSKKDIEDGKRISKMFASISDESKNMVISYISALRDKEMADSQDVAGEGRGEHKRRNIIYVFIKIKRR